MEPEQFSFEVLKEYLMKVLKNTDKWKKTLDRRNAQIADMLLYWRLNINANNKSLIPSSSTSNLELEKKKEINPKINSLIEEAKNVLEEVKNTTNPKRKSAISSEPIKLMRTKKEIKVTSKVNNCPNKKKHVDIKIKLPFELQSVEDNSNHGKIEQKNNFYLNKNKNSQHFVTTYKKDFIAKNKNITALKKSDSKNDNSKTISRGDKEHFLNLNNIDKILRKVTLYPPTININPKINLHSDDKIIKNYDCLNVLLTNVSGSYKNKRIEKILVDYNSIVLNLKQGNKWKNCSAQNFLTKLKNRNNNLLSKGDQINNYHKTSMAIIKNYQESIQPHSNYLRILKLNFEDIVHVFYDGKHLKQMLYDYLENNIINIQWDLLNLFKKESKTLYERKNNSPIIYKICELSLTFSESIEFEKNEFSVK